MDKKFTMMTDEINALLPGVLAACAAAESSPERVRRSRKYRPASASFSLEPVRILKNGVATIVFWTDGTKTVVKCGKDETPDDYDAFTAALAIKLFGSNSKLKKVIKEKTVVQQPKKGKE